MAALSSLFPLTVDSYLTGPAWTAEGDQAFAQLGKSVSCAGDVNGDGYSDVIVGAQYHDDGQSDEERALVYLGSPTGLASTPSWSAQSDQAGAEFGCSVASAGDVDGDGSDDVVVGALLFANGQPFEGGAFVYLGSASGLSSSPAWTAESDQASAGFGGNVASAGDVNGDGFCDVLVSAHQYDNGQTGEGRSFVYLGSASGLGATAAWMVEGEQENALSGMSAASAGDVNGDGYSDVLVGALLFDGALTDAGRASLYLGSAGGLESTAAWATEGSQAFSQFCTSLALAGDVNGDGHSDVLIADRAFDNGQENEGRVFAFLGAAEGLSIDPTWTAEGDQLTARFGASVASAGDVNGDGYGDVLVGAPDFDDGQSSEGRALLFLGSAVGIATSASWTAQGDQAGAELGSALASAGDVNGDGHGDVLVAAPNFDHGQNNEGRALVFLGSSGGLRAICSSTRSRPGRRSRASP